MVSLHSADNDNLNRPAELKRLELCINSYFTITATRLGPELFVGPICSTQPNRPNDQPNPTHTRVKIWIQDPTQPTTQPMP